MDKQHFWTMIEYAWNSVGGFTQMRSLLAEGRLSPEQAKVLMEPMKSVVHSLGKMLNQLPAMEVIAFDRILEKRLYNLDREDIYEVTDGAEEVSDESMDDRFLHERGFIVIMGEKYYRAVLNDPKKALKHFECRTISYLAAFIYEKKYGKFIESDARYKRETGSNKQAWGES